MIWTHDHWIPFRRSNRLSYQAMSSTHAQSQLCTATPILSVSSVCLGQASFKTLMSPSVEFEPDDPRLNLGNSYGGKPPDLMLITTLLHIQFHWQFLSIYSDFWLVNIPLRKFNNSSQKRNDKSNFYWWKTTTTCQESICKHKGLLFTVKSPHWTVM